MTPEQLAEAKRYGWQRLVWGLVDKAIDFVVLVVAAFVLARPVEAYLADAIPERTLRLAALFGLLAIAGGLVSLPLAWYRGYVLEHRYGLSRESLPRWLWRQLKMAVLGLLLGGVLVVGLFWIIWLTGPWWWLVAAAAFFAVSVVLGQLTPVLFLPLFYKTQRLDDPELLTRLSRLAEGTGVTIEGIYRLDLSVQTEKANAMLAGLGRTRRVLLGDTLLQRFSHDEIEVVMGHELGHHVHRHIPKMLLLGGLLSIAGLWLCDQVIFWIHPELTHHELPVYTMPLVILVLSVFGLIVGPLNAAISRHFERQCDRYALQRTGNPEAFISAFQKLAKGNKADPDPPWLEVLLFHSHPPISKRLAMAEAWRQAS